MSDLESHVAQIIEMSIKKRELELRESIAKQIEDFHLLYRRETTKGESDMFHAMKAAAIRIVRGEV